MYNILSPISVYALLANSGLLHNITSTTRASLSHIQCIEYIIMNPRTETLNIYTMYSGIGGPLVMQCIHVYTYSIVSGRKSNVQQHRILFTSWATVSSRDCQQEGVWQCSRIFL